MNLAVMLLVISDSISFQLTHIQSVSAPTMTRYVLLYELRTPYSAPILASVYLTVISTSSFPLQSWLLKLSIRMNNKRWVLCFLARLSLSCKFSDRFLHGRPLSKQHPFRLHGITCCQMIWFFRAQSGRSSKNIKALVRRCHCHFKR